MAKFEYNVHIEDRYVRQAENKLEGKSKAVIRDMADYLLSRIQFHLVKNRKVDTGETLRSIKRIPTADGYAVECGGAFLYIEKGRGPTKGGGTGEVRKAMEKKIRRRGIDVSDVAGKTKDQKIKNLAFMMARKIHKKGIKKTPIVEPAIKDLKSHQAEIIKKHRGK